MVVILIIAAVISAALRNYKDAVAIMAIVILSAVLGFVQDYQADRAMAALKRLAVPTVRVRRDGRIQEVSARALVPGDIILLETISTTLQEIKRSASNEHKKICSLNYSKFRPILGVKRMRLCPYFYVYRVTHGLPNDR